MSSSCPSLASERQIKYQNPCLRVLGLWVRVLDFSERPVEKDGDGRDEFLQSGCRMYIYIYIYIDGSQM
jgi:hypothetical protein